MSQLSIVIVIRGCAFYHQRAGWLSSFCIQICPHPEDPIGPLFIGVCFDTNILCFTVPFILIYFFSPSTVTSQMLILQILMNSWFLVFSVWFFVSFYRFCFNWFYEYLGITMNYEVGDKYFFWNKSFLIPFEIWFVHKPVLPDSWFPLPSQLKQNNNKIIWSWEENKEMREGNQVMFEMRVLEKGLAFPASLFTGNDTPKHVIVTSW